MGRRVERIEEAKQAEAQEEEQYEAAPLGPGGLDPTEVLQSLPEEIQEAFISQDKQKLVTALESMPPEEANDIIKRCIDSGLWNPDPNNSRQAAAEEAENAQPETAASEQASVPNYNDPIHDID